MSIQAELTIPSGAIETRSHFLTWSQLFWVMLFAHMSVWFIGPMLTMPTAPLDCIEKIALGLQWQWGYSKHPPLVHWISSLAFLGSGSPKWPLLFMAQISVGLCFLAIWQFSRRFLPTWGAFAAVFCLEGIYYFTFATPQFNENIILLPLWSWAAILIYDGITKQSLFAWIAAGILAGLACIAKYETLVFLLTIFLFVCINPDARKSWRYPGIYLALALCSLICLPNLIWLVHNDFLPIHYAMNKTNHSKGHLQPVIDLFAQIAAILPGLLLLLPFWFNRNKNPNKSHELMFSESYLKFVALGPVTITFSMAILKGAHIYALWGIPFFIWLGTWLMVKWQPNYSARACRVFLILMLAMATLMVVGRTVQLHYGPQLNGRVTYQHYPAKQLANAASDLWHSEYSSEMPVVAGSSWAVQSIVAYSSKPYPKPYVEWSDESNAWLNTTDVNHLGGIFVYEIKSENVNDFPAEIRERFPKLQQAHKIILPYQTHAAVKPLEVLMAILPLQH